jgi:hypothetical protein
MSGCTAKLMVSFIVMVNIPIKIPMGHTHYLDARDSAHLVSFNPSKIGFHSTLCLVWRIKVFKIFNIFEYSTAINMKIIIIQDDTPFSLVSWHLQFGRSILFPSCSCKKPDFLRNILNFPAWFKASCLRILQSSVLFYFSILHYIRE